MRPYHLPLTTIYCLLPTASLLGSRRHLFRLFSSLFNAADVHERLFRQMIPFAVANFVERTNRVRQRGNLTFLAGKRFGNEERL